MKKILYLFAGFTVLLLAPLFVKAATEGIQISPLTFKYEIKEDLTQEGSVFVKNLNPEPLNYIMEVENFHAVTEEGAPNFDPAAQKSAGVTTLADWVVIPENKEGTLKTNEEREIKFTITVPTGAEPGGHYAAIFAKSIVKNSEGVTQLGVSSRVGTLVLVTVPGTTIKTNSITSFVAPKFVWKGPIDLTMKVQNTGTVHYESKGLVDIKPLLGNSLSVDMGTHIVLPDNTRSYEGKWATKYPFGRYVLTPSATDGNNATTTLPSVIVWAIPLVIVIPILVGLLLLYIIIRVLKARYHIVTNKN